MPTPAPDQVVGIERTLPLAADPDLFSAFDPGFEMRDQFGEKLLQRIARRR
jgi:hypothetical protein